jgi:hypothetical protein
MVELNGLKFKTSAHFYFRKVELKKPTEDTVGFEMESITQVAGYVRMFFTSLKSFSLSL